MEWIKNYLPKSKEEEEEKAHILRLPSSFIGLERSLPYHFTTSSIIVDPKTRSLLMVYHKIYQSWSWPGGHVEKGEDLFSSALREVYEETGLEYVQPLEKSPYGMELLPVKQHLRKAEGVDSHFHINFTFAFYAKERDLLLSERREGVMWVPIEKLDLFVTESHMLPIYKKYIDRMAK